jgi:hypothetical protein
MLQGEDITVNPQDNDELHLIRHKRDIQEAEKSEKPDQTAIRKLAVHYMQHIEQLQQKKIVQAVAEQAVGAIQQLGAAGMMPQQLMGGQPQEAQNRERFVKPPSDAR